MNHISEILDGVSSVGIAGHVRPDGDCVGSCMGLYLYLKQEYPKLDIDVYLDHPREVFGYIDRMDEVLMEADDEKQYDLFITLDVSSMERIALAGECFRRAARTCCIDHHISNRGFADVNHVRGDISSASEVLYGLLDKDRVTLPVATAIYTGMAHDTGIFQYSSTSPQTMTIAGELMAKGVDFSTIIDESFYQKTYLQNQIMGRVLAESVLLLNGQCVAGVLTNRDLMFYGATSNDLEGIVSQLRLTAGVQVAIFIYEYEPGVYKVSLRSNGKADVSKVATYFGGGGHVRAAGCDIIGTANYALDRLTEQIQAQILKG